MSKAQIGCISPSFDTEVQSLKKAASSKSYPGNKIVVCNVRTDAYSQPHSDLWSCTKACNAHSSLSLECPYNITTIAGTMGPQQRSTIFYSADTQKSEISLKLLFSFVLSCFQWSDTPLHRALAREHKWHCVNSFARNILTWTLI